jgi:hypothetical protein
MKVTVESKDNAFAEGELVCLKTDTSDVFLVTCAAEGYSEPEDDTFWAINLTGCRRSGNYQKDLFQRFAGTITIEV